MTTPDKDTVKTAAATPEPTSTEVSGGTIEHIPVLLSQDMSLEPSFTLSIELTPLVGPNFRYHITKNIEDVKYGEVMGQATLGELQSLSNSLATTLEHFATATK